MSKIEPLTKNLWVAQSAVFATNSALLLDAGSCYLVDPGITPTELDHIVAFVAGSRATLRGIVLTHAHWDHLLGPERFPQAPVIAQDAYRALLRRHASDLIRQVTDWRTETDVPQERSFVPPNPDVTFSKQLRLYLGPTTLRVLATPGHAPDHCSLYESRSGLLWAGDMLSDLEVPMVMDTFAAYRQTLRRLAALEIRSLVPGHGTPTTDPREIHDRFAGDLVYLGEVYDCAAKAVEQGAELAETLDCCVSIPFAQPDSYPNAHRWNIEQAYLEAGGKVTGIAGWAQDWA